MAEERAQTPQYTIYTLVDPRDNSTRYVGLSLDMYNRFAQHILDHGNRAKRTWIDDLKQQGFMPQLVVLEKDVESLDLARAREAHWISFYLSAGANLTNIQKLKRPKVAQRRIKVLKGRFDQLGTLRHRSGISTEQMIWRLEGITSRRYRSIESGGTITFTLANQILSTFNSLLIDAGKQPVTLDELGLTLYGALKNCR